MAAKILHDILLALGVAGISLSVSCGCMSSSTKGAKKKKAEPAEESDTPPLRDLDSAPPSGDVGGESDYKVEEDVETNSVRNEYGDARPTEDAEEAFPSTSPSTSATTSTATEAEQKDDAPPPETRDERFEELVANWDGENNIPDQKGVWKVVDAEADESAAEPEATVSPGDRPDQTTETRSASGEVDCLSPEAATSQAQTFVFTIKQGTGKGAWNERNNPCIIRAGKTLKFVNNDSVPKMPHFNGNICAHPDTRTDRMQQGGTYSCVPQRPTNLIETYDHFDEAGTASRIYFQVVQ